LQGINANKITTIINSFRIGCDPEEILIKHGKKNEQLFNLLRTFSTPFDPKRNKKTCRPSVFKVIEKWLTTSSIDNRSRSNYSTELSEESIKYICDFVEKSKNKRVTLTQLKDQLSVPISESTISRYLKKNNLSSYAHKKKKVNTVEKDKCLEFANN
jgi:hypothetical protein